MIVEMTDGFVFPVGKDVSDGDEATAQTLHDLTVALGASCTCKRKTLRRKALHRGANRVDALALARAKLRRLALLQDLTVAETAPL